MVPVGGIGWPPCPETCGSREFHRKDVVPFGLAGLDKAWNLKILCLHSCHAWEQLQSQVTDMVLPVGVLVLSPVEDETRYNPAGRPRRGGG